MISTFCRCDRRPSGFLHAVRRASTSTGWVCSLILGLVALAGPAEALAQGRAGTMRIYQTRFISGETGMLLAFQVCEADGDENLGRRVDERCHVEAISDSQFALHGDEAAHGKLAELLGARDVPPPTQEFRVILLSASDNGAMPELPDGAREAMDDVLSVLPYSGYELIDSGWLRTASYASTSLGTMGSFQVEMRFHGDPQGVEGLMIEHFELSHRPIHYTGMGGGQTGEIPQALLGDARHLLGSSFGIHIGETVVVGTSRANGGTGALVVLLTALEPR